jgi:hypothetical protein
MDFWERDWKECIETAEVKTFIWKMGFHVVKETQKLRIDVLVALSSNSSQKFFATFFMNREKQNPYRTWRTTKL